MKSLWATVLVVGLASGCGERDESVVETAGTKVGEALTDFASGVGEGVDKRMEVTVELSPNCSEAGLSMTVAKSLGFKEGIAVYFIAEEPFNGQLVAKAVNAKGQEVGRSKVVADFEVDDAQYVTFSFGFEMDSQLVEKYLVDTRYQLKVEPETENSDSPTAADDQ